MKVLLFAGLFIGSIGFGFLFWKLYEEMNQEMDEMSEIDPVK